MTGTKDIIKAIRSLENKCILLTRTTRNVTRNMVFKILLEH